MGVRRTGLGLRVRRLRRCGRRPGQLRRPADRDRLRGGPLDSRRGSPARGPRSCPSLHSVAGIRGQHAGPGRLDRRLGSRRRSDRTPGRHRALRAQGPRIARRLPLPPERHRLDRQDPHRSLVRRTRRGREGAHQPLGDERHLQDPGRRTELRGPRQSRLLRGRRRPLARAAHALPRQGHEVHRLPPGRRGAGTAQRQPLRLQLADRLRVRRAPGASGRHQDRGRRPLGQLGGQPQQSRTRPWTSPGGPTRRTRC